MKTRSVFKIYRGYPYRRVSDVRLKIWTPDGAFLCMVPNPRDLVKEINRDLLRRQVCP
jgi:hypothetical protein